jgi:hypothetical protein
MLIHGILPASRANGPGERFTVWTQGCSRGCPGCFNPATHEDKKMKKEKWWLCQLSPRELEDFIEKAKTGNENESAFIGTVSGEAAQRIQELCGENVSKIRLNSWDIRHAYEDDKHYLEKDDVYYSAYVINNPSKMELSSRKNKDRHVLKFTGNIG